MKLTEKQATAIKKNDVMPINGYVYRVLRVRGIDYCGLAAVELLLRCADTANLSYFNLLTGDTMEVYKP